ncbi:MAG TPA: glycosyltransferase 87 family protein [Acidobacteriaceae bacterium]|nr:glycosyltransferase 87 family protein [Acidobacteriaceae bacterium]
MADLCTRKCWQVLAGVLLGLLVAGKPNYLLWPLLLAIRGRWRSSAIAITVAATLSAIPLIVYGPDVYREWIFAIANNPHWSLGTDVSITGIARMLGVPLSGRLRNGVLVLAAFLVVIWKRPSLRDTSGIALTVGTLAPPLA